MNRKRWLGSTCLLVTLSLLCSMVPFSGGKARASEGTLVNADFEQVADGKPVGWVPLDSASVFESVYNPVHSGQAAVKLTDGSSNGGNGLRSGKIAVTPENSYRASAYSYNESGVSQLYLEFWNSASVRIGVTIKDNQAVGTWNKMEIEAEAPEDAAYATLLLYQHKANVGIAYFDTASFELVPPEPVRDFPLVVDGHPRLYFTADDLPQLRAIAGDDTHTAFGTTGKRLWTQIEAAAQNYLTESGFSVTYYGGYVVTYPLPPAQPQPMPNPPGYTEGPYPYWTAMARGVQDRLTTLGLAYAVTGEHAYAERAKQIALAVAGWNAWTDPTYPCGGATCLDTAHLTFGVSAAYDMIYDTLAPEERAALENALETKGLKPLYKDAKNRVDNNIQTLRVAALGSGAAALLGQSADANKYLTRAGNFYRWYLDERMNSGQQEGLLYTGYAMDNLIRAIDHIARVTGTRDLIEHPFLNDFVVRWSNYFLAPGGGGQANFSDADAANYFPLTMKVLNSGLHNGNAGWYLTETGGAASGDVDGFLYYHPDAPVAKPDNWPASAVLDEIGWAALRSGWGEDDTLLAFISNHSRLGHNHYDQNSFQIATNSSWIAGDPGYQDYVSGPVHDFTVQLGHSTIQVDGRGQSAKGGGMLTRGMLAPTYDYVKVRRRVLTPIRR